MTTIGFGQYFQIAWNCSPVGIGKDLSGSWISWWPSRLCAEQARWSIAALRFKLSVQGSQRTGHAPHFWILLLDIEMRWDALSINIGRTGAFTGSTYMNFRHRQFLQFVCAWRKIARHSAAWNFQFQRIHQRYEQIWEKSCTQFLFRLIHCEILDSSSLMLRYVELLILFVFDRWNRMFARGASRDISIVPVANWRHILLRHSSQCCIRWHGFSNFGCGWSPRSAFFDFFLCSTREVWLLVVFVVFVVGFEGVLDSCWIRVTDVTDLMFDFTFAKVATRRQQRLGTAVRAVTEVAQVHQIWAVFLRTVWPVDPVFPVDLEAKTWNRHTNFLDYVEQQLRLDLVLFNIIQQFSTANLSFHVWNLRSPFQVKLSKIIGGKANIPGFQWTRPRQNEDVLALTDFDSFVSVAPFLEKSDDQFHYSLYLVLVVSILQKRFIISCSTWYHFIVHCFSFEHVWSSKCKTNSTHL